MILLGIPPFPSRNNLRHQRLLLIPLFLHLLLDTVRYLLLLPPMRKNRTPILRAHIWPLAVRSGRIMHAEEKIQQLCVRELLWVVRELHRFGVPRRARAHGAIAWVLRGAAAVADARIEQALAGELLAEEVFDAPEASVVPVSPPLEERGRRRNPAASVAFSVFDGWDMMRVEVERVLMKRLRTDATMEEEEASNSFRWTARRLSDIAAPILVVVALRSRWWDFTCINTYRYVEYLYKLSRQLALMYDRDEAINCITIHVALFTPPLAQF
jgi:hypothetical protein